MINHLPALRTSNTGLKSLSRANTRNIMRKKADKKLKFGKKVREYLQVFEGYYKLRALHKPPHARKHIDAARGK